MSINMNGRSLLMGDPYFKIKNIELLKTIYLDSSQTYLGFIGTSGDLIKVGDLVVLKNKNGENSKLSKVINILHGVLGQQVNAALPGEICTYVLAPVKEIGDEEMKSQMVNGNVIIAINDNEYTEYNDDVLDDDIEMLFEQEDSATEKMREVREEGDKVIGQTSERIQQVKSNKNYTEDQAKKVIDQIKNDATIKLKNIASKLSGSEQQEFLGEYSAKLSQIISSAEAIYKNNQAALMVLEHGLKSGRIREVKLPKSFWL